MSRLEIQQLSVDYPLPREWPWWRRRTLRAVDRLDLQLDRGEILGLVGESGCGKTSLLRALVGLLPVAGGQIRYGGEELRSLKGAALRRWRGRIQWVGQDPRAVLDPRRTVGEIVAEGPLIHGRVSRARLPARVREALEQVGLDPGVMSRYPHEFSGGQRARIVLARSLAVEPELLLLDEPLAALDIVVQADILSLLAGLRRRYGYGIALVSHDLGVVRGFCDRVVVLEGGRIVEQGAAADVLSSPRHPTTRALVSEIPRWEQPS